MYLFLISFPKYLSFCMKTPFGDNTWSVAETLTPKENTMCDENYNR